MKLVVAVVATALAAACARPPVAGPPAIRMGADACDGCGMAIGDERYAAAIAGTSAGERRVLLFDDIGCLARWEVAHADFAPSERWVHDRDSRRWIDGSNAVFARRAEWSTPMGSGIAAFAPANGSAGPPDPMTWNQVLDAARRGGLDRPAGGTTEEGR